MKTLALAERERVYTEYRENLISKGYQPEELPTWDEFQLASKALERTEKTTTFVK